jgi:hypothetical protein
MLDEPEKLEPAPFAPVPADVPAATSSAKDLELFRHFRCIETGIDWKAEGSPAGRSQCHFFKCKQNGITSGGLCLEHCNEIETLIESGVSYNDLSQPLRDAARAGAQFPANWPSEADIGAPLASELLAPLRIALVDVDARGNVAKVAELTIKEMLAVRAKLDRLPREADPMVGRLRANSATIQSLLDHAPVAEGGGQLPFSGLSVVADDDVPDGVVMKDYRCRHCGGLGVVSVPAVPMPRWRCPSCRKWHHVSYRAAAPSTDEMPSA